jgi:hypothetical protein
MFQHAQSGFDLWKNRAEVTFLLLELYAATCHSSIKEKLL